MLVGTPSHKHLATCSIHAALRSVMQQCGKKEADGILSVIRDGNRVPPRCQNDSSDVSCQILVSFSEKSSEICRMSHVAQNSLHQFFLITSHILTELPRNEKRSSLHVFRLLSFSASVC